MKFNGFLPDSTCPRILINSSVQLPGKVSFHIFHGNRTTLRFNIDCSLMVHDVDPRRRRKPDAKGAKVCAVNRKEKFRGKRNNRRVMDSKGENETCYSLLLELAYSLTISLQASANGLHQAKTVFYRLDAFCFFFYSFSSAFFSLRRSFLHRSAFLLSEARRRSTWMDFDHSEQHSRRKGWSRTRTKGSWFRRY